MWRSTCAAVSGTGMFLSFISLRVLRSRQRPLDMLVAEARKLLSVVGNPIFLALGDHAFRHRDAQPVAQGIQVLSMKPWRR